MKSVLITTDYVRRNDGTLTPVEINTNSAFDIRLTQYPITVSNFELNFNEFFDHIKFNSFLIENNINKVITIENANRFSQIFNVFCEKYGYDFEENIIGSDSMVPDIEEDEHELVIRIAYDTFAILDDLYARDMYEFHNLIQNEDFSSPVFFTSSLDLDTIELELPIETDWPNYMLKSRLPGYDIKDYPKLYSITTEQDLETIKDTIGEDEFLQKYEIHSGSLQETDGRSSAYRSADLIYGEDLQTLQLFSVEKTLEVSIDNEKFIYDTPYKDNGIELNSLHSSRFLPINKLLFTYPYHIDDSDYVLSSTDTLISATDLEIDTKLSTVVFSSVVESGSIGYPLKEEDLQNFIITGSNVVGFTENPNPNEEHSFINVTVEHPEYGEFTWYDGITTPYYIQKNGTPTFMFFYEDIGFVEEGDRILIYNKEVNEMVPFNVINVVYDMKKNKQMSLVSLSPNPKFFVEITNQEYSHDQSPLFLIQHNTCNANNCGPFSSCSSFGQCFSCSKNDSNCPDCGGFSFGMYCFGF